jgi:alpha-N-acetylglucosamine transferase
MPYYYSRIKIKLRLESEIMIQINQESFQNEKKIIQVMANFTNIRPQIKKHNEFVTKLFENQLKNAVWQARIRGKSLSNNEYYGIVKDFWKNYYIYEI